MKILITGGSGFIGEHLCQRLLDYELEIVVLSRCPSALSASVEAIDSLSQLSDADSFDVIINLAGEAIAAKRWSDQQKARILRSRFDITEDIIAYIKRAKVKPQLLISGSAIGYYGIDDEHTSVDENGAPDESFSSQLCQQWEAIAQQAESLGVRTCLLRTGIVLGKNGGVLSKMLTPFKMALGGRIGHGQQSMSWIHIDDLVGIILLCISNDKLKGAINGTAPNPLSNVQFTKALGEAVNRPTALPMPSFMIKLLMGQMGEELLLSGKAVLPERALRAGYEFQYPRLAEALADVI